MRLVAGIAGMPEESSMKSLRKSLLFKLRAAKN
jgi:hypothetical protein